MSPPQQIPDHAARMERVALSLDGLSTGDAFGQQFFNPALWQSSLRGRKPPPPRWKYTDDTVMALAIRETLDHFGRIEQDALAQNFSRRYHLEPHRGYGPGVMRLLTEIGSGGDWRSSATSLFRGEGSLGNGAAMRVAPVGAYFADDLPQVVAQAIASAEVTHAHPEGQAGAIAVAVACAWACQWRAGGRRAPICELLDVVLDHTPRGATHHGLHAARQLALVEWEHAAAQLLGNGDRITASDTVPFCLWCASARLHDYREAMWSTVQVEGDIDTNCAIVGGIVALAVGREGLPAEWLRSREELLLSSAPP